MKLFQGMWIAQLLGTNKRLLIKVLLLTIVASVVFFYPYLQGNCQVGRNAGGNSISFDNDKSISRAHAEIELGPNETLLVKDLGSKFGTFLVDGNDATRIGGPQQVVSGQTFRFGALQSRVTFHFGISFCTTRLEKKDKEKLKNYCAQLKATVVNQPEFASYLVATKFAATVKMLTAIVLNVPLITLEWFSFLDNFDSLNGAIELPSPEKYATFLVQSQIVICMPCIDLVRLMLEILFKYKISISHDLVSSAILLLC